MLQLLLPLNPNTVIERKNFFLKAFSADDIRHEQILHIQEKLNLSKATIVSHDVSTINCLNKAKQTPESWYSEYKASKPIIEIMLNNVCLIHYAIFSSRLEGH